MRTCLGCGSDLEEEGSNFHQSCLLTGTHTACVDLAEELKASITHIIEWADQNSPRSTQAMIGPSELGDVCDRRIAYRLLGLRVDGRRADPWAAIVGTSIHQWLETAVTRFNQEHHSQHVWLTESDVMVDDWVPGHSDLYHVPSGTVIDYKTMSTDKMKLVRAAGWAGFPGYLVQAHLYGKGFAALGHEVKNVALVCLPRAGRLRDMHVLAEPYDERIAQYALDRMYRIGETIVTADLANNPDRWGQVPAVKSDACGFCPMFRAGFDGPASDKGCGGV